MKVYFKYIVFILLMVSCEEVTDWDQKGEFVPKLVVEGVLTNKPGYSYVKLSLPVVSSDEKVSDVSEAFVAISFDGETFERFAEDPDDSGNYKPENDFRGVSNRAYILYIKIGDYEFNALAMMIPVSPLKIFTFYKDTDNESYYKINFPEENYSSMIKYIADYVDPKTGEARHSVFYHYNLSSVDVNQFFKPATQSLSFPENTRIIREKYSLAPGHEKYIRSLLSETEWNGGWFDLMPGNLQTNLSAGAVGYFSASSLVVDTVYFHN